MARHYQPPCYHDRQPGGPDWRVICWRNLPKKRNGSKVELPIAKQALASLLDLRPETLSRILNKLAEDGLIAMDTDCITLIQPVSLNRI